MNTLSFISLIANCILATMAIIAGAVSWFEYKSHKQKENNKLLKGTERSVYKALCLNIG